MRKEIHDEISFSERSLVMMHGLERHNTRGIRRTIKRLAEGLKKMWA